jgi:hypothetical protein
MTNCTCHAGHFVLQAKLAYADSASRYNLYFGQLPNPLFGQFSCNYLKPSSILEINGGRLTA